MATVITPVPSDLKPPADRLTLVFNLYREHHGDDTFHPNIPPITRLLETSEEPYSRRMKAFRTWSELDLGWLDPDSIGWVVIENIEGRDLVQNPTPDERSRIESRVILLSLSGRDEDAWEIIPGLIHFGRPRRGSKMYVRSVDEEAMFRVHLVPR